jgi:hypothetical protein
MTVAQRKAPGLWSRDQFGPNDLKPGPAPSFTSAFSGASSYGGDCSGDRLWLLGCVAALCFAGSNACCYWADLTALPDEKAHGTHVH